MLMPSIFNDNLFDDFFDFPFYDDKADRKIQRKLYGHHAGNLMKTDIKEKKDGYELEIDLPGFKKDEAGACQRSYYVGEDITEEDIKAEFKHGILKLFVPKKEVKPAVEEKKYISIEG